MTYIDLLNAWANYINDTPEHYLSNFLLPTLVTAGSLCVLRIIFDRFTAR